MALFAENCHKGASSVPPNLGELPTRIASAVRAGAEMFALGPLLCSDAAPHSSAIIRKTAMYLVRATIEVLDYADVRTR